MNGKLHVAGFDERFWTPNKRIDLSGIVQLEVLPKKSKRFKFDGKREEKRDFGKVRKWHSGNESAIHER